MLTTTAFVAILCLAPGQAGQLTLANPRMTYGILGPPRTGSEFLPGDSLVFAFNIQGVKTDSAGKVRYSVGLEVTDANSKTVFKQEPTEREASLTLGGDSLPGFAKVQIGTDQPAGTYALKVTVTDRESKGSKSITHPFKVLPKSFGLVGLYASQDPEGKFPAAFVGEGETLWLSFSAVGFGRDSREQPNISVSLRVLDETGKPTLAQPYTGEVSKEVPNTPGIPMQFMLELNRAGKFTIDVQATDNVSMQSASFTLPIVISRTG